MTCLYFDSSNFTLSLIGSFFPSHLRLVQELGLLCQLHFTKHDDFTTSPVQPAIHTFEQQITRTEAWATGMK